jgi:hypothetical protein
LFLLALTVSSSVGIYNKIKGEKGIRSQNSIAVAGTGEVYAKPDLSLVELSVITEEKTIASSLGENTEKMNVVISFIKGQGIEEKDLKTTYFNISPRYEYRTLDGGIYAYYIPNGTRVLVGYEVSQKLQVKIRDLEKIGAIIDGATLNGANDVSQLQFTIENQDELKKQARAEAIEKAKSKAKEMAGQVGVKLGKVISFNESTYTPWLYDSAMKSESYGLGGTGEVPQPQIEAGQSKITVNVNIVYEID